ncbi:DUF1972 domain-containing protein [Faecalicoccus acidiformans]|uniref:beta 1-4 rhamnosyltransferase Cps2T n=1 Tax=Faecalicoccus acidiformans TaxID=915173 RepID=UPI0025A3F200|nr:DUF1972 domain-containing protein [Faecalicoccus acidiformans]MDM8203640.1 DUF1972 domain-containing protein [Faecalicoccus acidiformans]
MKNVFIIGSKGIPANYGGFETFVDELVSRKQNKNIQYHVACMSDNVNEFEYNGAHCFNINVPSIGAAKAVYYDIEALKYCVNYIKERKLSGSIVYILACRIGPFVKKYVKQLHNMNCKVYVNPDGHEWKRSKWNTFIKKYWKLSERLMVKYADLLICDSKNIEKYIQNDYKKYNPSTTFIAYGADINKSTLKDDDPKVLEWYEKHQVKPKSYYLIVGRFVPENNYETMIKEFMKSNTKRDLVLITNVEKNKFYDQLKEETHFDQDKRIKFVGTVYDTQLLKKIRENAYAYIHGHEVGGTNPSLLEALASTDLNLLLDVGFNREVAEDGAFYWTKDDNYLSKTIEKINVLKDSTRITLSYRAKERIDLEYSWNKIVDDYEILFRK